MRMLSIILGLFLGLCATVQAQNTQTAMDTAWQSSQTAKNTCSDSHLEYVDLLSEIYHLLFESQINNLTQLQRDDIWCQAHAIIDEFEQSVGPEYGEAWDGLYEWTHQQYLSAREDGPITYAMCVGYCDTLKDVWDEIDADIEEFICRLSIVKQSAQAN